jgi:copper chaperone
MEIKFNTEGMACSMCEARVVEKLSSIPGVASVTAQAADGSVVVTGENLDRDTLAQAIEDLGFDVL